MIDLDGLKLMWEKDSVISENDLDGATIDGARLHAKYLDMYGHSRLLLKKKEQELAQMKLLKFRWYNGSMTKEEMDRLKWDYDPYQGCNKPIRSDRNAYIETDPDVSNLILKVEYYKVVVDLLKEILDTLKWRHQSIRNIIQWRQFTSGV